MKNEIIIVYDTNKQNECYLKIKMLEISSKILYKDNKVK